LEEASRGAHLGVVAQREACRKMVSCEVLYALTRDRAYFFAISSPQAGTSGPRGGAPVTRDPGLRGGGAGETAPPCRNRSPPAQHSFDRLDRRRDRLVPAQRRGVEHDRVARRAQGGILTLG